MFRSRFFCVFGCMLLVLCSCTKTAEAKSKNQTEEKENPAVLAHKSKVDAVISKMSPRFLAKYQITDSNMDQFINDLQLGSSVKITQCIWICINMVLISLVFKYLKKLK